MATLVLWVQCGYAGRDNRASRIDFAAESQQQPAASTAQGPDRSSSLCPAAGLAAAGAGVWGCHTKLSIFHSGARRGELGSM